MMQALFAIAQEPTYMGQRGYLATITSPEEYRFIFFQLGATNAYVSLSDEGSEGTWKYISGPEAGQTATFLPWGTGEATGGTAENCAALLQEYGGYFDISCTFDYGATFVIEYDSKLCI